MNFETIKSFILVILIGMSLFLSFIIWNYQPKYGPLQSKYVSEADIGGDEVTKRSVVKPQRVIFHKNGNHYSFHDIHEQTEFYEAMYDWNFTDATFQTPPRLDVQNEMIELIFPYSLPVKSIQTIYSIEDFDQLPSWSFDRILIIPNKQLLTLDVYFLSPNEEQSLRLTVSSLSTYTDVTEPLEREHHLAKYTSLITDEKTFYLPEKSVNINRRSLAIEYIDPALLVNALFRNPSLVSHTIGRSTYNDGQRMMEVLNDGRSMEFTNPIELKSHLSFDDLLDITINDINQHKGWTNTFVLDEVDIQTNRLQFKMYYDGYPIFSHEDYSMIEQRWEGNDLYQYKRPLFRLTNLLNSEPATLVTGKDIVQYLMENENYQLDQINDIRLGYRLTYEAGSFSVRLEPTWYLKYNNRWTELIVESSEQLDKGGV